MDNKLICIYLNGKAHVDGIRKLKEKESTLERIEKASENVQALNNIAVERERREQELLQRDIQKANDDYFAKEQEKIQKNKAMKQAKIREHILEVERQKKAQLLKLEEKRFEMANRIKNMEVDKEKDKLEKQELSKFKVDNREFLAAQIKEREEFEKAEKAEDAKCTNTFNEREDKFFFDYANTLLNDAESKDRNTYPIIKAIQKYKKTRSIDMEKNVPPHLVTHLVMGRREGEKPDSPKVKYGIDELKKLESNVSCVCCPKNTSRK